jgi:hypothetical protein
MEKLFIVLMIVAGIVGIVSRFFSREKIHRYVKDKKGNLVSTERAYPSNPKNHSLRVKYYDKHKNLRQVVYQENGLFSLFGDDEIIEYSKNSPEYIEILKKEKDYLNRGKEFVKKYYSVKEGELVIQQEFTQINRNEFVFLNDVKAPNGKYKLGFMNYIIVENGKIKEISMM